MTFFMAFIGLYGSLFPDGKPMLPFIIITDPDFRGGGLRRVGNSRQWLSTPNTGLPFVVWAAYQVPVSSVI